MRLPSLIATLSLVALAACGKGNDDGGATANPAPPPPTSSTAVVKPATADPAVAAKTIFQQRCTPCHGNAGAGDGAAAGGLVVKPANFQDPAWQASVTDEHIMKVIQYGGAAVGKDAAMPGNPDLKDPAVIAAIKDYVRGLAAK